MIGVPLCAAVHSQGAGRGGAGRSSPLVLLIVVVERGPDSRSPSTPRLKGGTSTQGGVVYSHASPRDAPLHPRPLAPPGLRLVAPHLSSSSSSSRPHRRPALVPATRQPHHPARFVRRRSRRSILLDPDPASASTQPPHRRGRSPPRLARHRARHRPPLLGRSAARKPWPLDRGPPEPGPVLAAIDPEALIEAASGASLSPSRTSLTVTHP